MEFFRRLFGLSEVTSDKEPVVKQLNTRKASEVRADNSLVSVYAAGGREVFLNKNQWRDEILPANIEEYKDNADELCQLILTGMRDNLLLETLPAARRLLEIDPDFKRSTSLLAITLIELKEYDEAMSILNSYHAKRGPSDQTLLLKAKVLSYQGREQDYLKALDEAIDIAPNNPGAIEWRGAIALEQGGETAYKEILEELYKTRRSWRALFWLGRLELDHGDVESAIERFLKIQDICGTYPADVAMAISGDLGKAEAFTSVIDLFGSPFKADEWGIFTGNNLIGACLSLGDSEKATQYLKELQCMKRPQWSDHLRYLAEQIAQRQSS